MATSEVKQLNLRISAKAHRILETIVYAHSAGSIQKLVAPVVEKYAEERAREPKIKKILGASETQGGPSS